MHLTRRTLLQGSLASWAVTSTTAAPATPNPVLPQEADLSYLTISDAASLLRSRKLSPVDLMQAVIARIKEVEPKVGAFITVLAEEAMQAAKVAEQEIMKNRYRSPLHGIPVGVKDNEYTRGIATTAATPVLKDFIPTFDATVITRLKAAGAIVVGKTNLPEFSFGGHTPGTQNPWDLSRSAGGSSGGSGAALAAGMILGATGGDTSGSIRNPAACNGIVGLKPTYGRVSLHGIVPISWSLDHLGPMTRTVRDNALMLNVLAGFDPLDDSSADVPVPDYTGFLRDDVKGMRLGVPEDRWFEGYHGDVLKAFEAALDLYGRLGARVVEVELPPSTAVINEVQRIIRIAEASAYHAQYLKTAADRYGPSNVRRDVEAGSMITAAQYLRAQTVRRVFLRDMRTLFESFDVFLTPGKPAPAGEPENTSQNFRSMFNTLGFPAMVLPSGFSASRPRLPVALQIVAKPFGEGQIYRAAYAYQNRTDWHRQRPPL